MRAEELKNRLECFPIIAAIRDNRWRQALASPAEILFYLEANILTVRDRIRQAHEAEKFVFVHLDLAEGIGKDRSGLQFLRECGVDGIISTRTNIIKTAREQGLFTVQRFFIVDSHSISTTLEALKASKADMLEIMPGILPRVIRTLRERIEVPIIAGGLIETEADIRDAVENGASAVSTSRRELWHV